MFGVLSTQMMVKIYNNLGVIETEKYGGEQKGPLSKIILWLNQFLIFRQ